MKDEFYVPDPEQIRYQSANNKQGRSDESVPLDEAMRIIERLEKEQKEVYAHYQELLDSNVARELARSNLPISLYTEWYWQIDLHNLFHFLRLRMDDHAQYEIRVFAEAMATCAKAVAPIAYEAFEEHILGSVSFSRGECEALMAVMNNRPVTLEGRALVAFEEKMEKLKAAHSQQEQPEEPRLPEPAGA
jgi:thymidylate synthase (FAD)